MLVSRGIKKKVVRKKPRHKYRVLVRVSTYGVWQVDVYNGRFEFLHTTDAPENTKESAMGYAQKVRLAYNNYVKEGFNSLQFKNIPK